jgi:voltage-gated potassium channel
VSDRTIQGIRSRRPTLRRRLALALLAFPTLVAVGTLGYMAIEGWSFSDALFMAATTITTVGFGEVRPLSDRGRLFTILLLLVGLAAVWYALSALVRVALEGELGLRWEERRMERQVHQVHDHHVVAGFGRVGRQTAHALRDLGHQVVVIEADPAAVREAITAGFLVVEGDATEDATLARAGIGQAAGLLTALGSDADNVFVTLSARALHATLPIVARANEASAIAKLTRAGATQVVSPYDAASRQMARLALRPRTVDFIEDLFKGPSGALVVEDVRVDPGSPLVGMTVREVQAQVPHTSFVAVLRDGQTVAPLAADFRLAGGDRIAAVGTEATLRLLETFSQGAGR